MDVSIDTTQRQLNSRRHGWEQVAECIRHQRIVTLWVHFRDASAEFVARAPYRRKRGLLLQEAFIVRVALRADQRVFAPIATFRSTMSGL
jgi:hypothetical protein